MNIPIQTKMVQAKLKRKSHTVQRITVGGRVAWFADHKLCGTIQRICLTSYPFYVVWDSGRDDWYRGDQLHYLGEKSEGTSENWSGY